MSANILHIFAPTRFDNVGAIVGDQTALRQLRNAISDAIDSGTGGTHLLQSNGEGYSLAVLQTADMSNVRPPFPGDVPTGQTTQQTIGMRALPRFLEAIQKSRAQLRPALIIPQFVPRPSSKKVP
jgi:hypothetical protein